ncbi:MAG TPA: hypothetical protein VGJ85_08240 [Candidatus Nanopelagicaceae bacterium]|jgi:tetratricopeptide (TPR) repeat protein/transcription elongation GreA/GreB family factor
MSPISQRFAIPTNDDEFEQICLEVLRVDWNRPELQLFGKRGERQFGIDILDLSGQTQLYAAQCKLKEEHKSLTPSAIQTEVDNALLFTPKLDKYGILTTAKISTHSQRKIREINEKHRAEGWFEVELFTWDRICELLRQNPEIAEQFYGDILPRRAQKIEQSVSQLGTGIAELTTAIAGNDVDSEINEARDYVNRKEFQIAKLLLNRIQQKRGSQLSAFQTFRLKSNLAACAFGENKYQLAAQLFLEAYTYYPNDELAQINRVLGHYLAGDITTAHKLASEIVDKFSASPRLVSLWILTASQDRKFSELEASVNSVLKTNGEVCAALARRALTEFDFITASSYAKKAAAALPDWSQPQALIAQSEIGKAVRPGGIVSPQEPDLDLAEKHATEGLQLAKRENNEEGQIEALLQRVEIKILTDKREEALEDIEAAHRINPDHPNVLQARAQHFLGANRIDDAIVTLARAFSSHPRADIAFMYGRTLANRGSDSDLDTAIAVMSTVDLSSLPQFIRAPLTISAMQCILTKKDWDKARDYINQVKPFVGVALSTAFEGMIAHNQNATERAEQLALTAKAELEANAPPDTKEYIAKFLVKVGRQSEALGILQQLFESNVSTFDPRLLLDCAAQMRRDDLVLDTCEKLLSRGTAKWDLVEFEGHFLEKYNIEKAIGRLRSFLNDYPDHRFARLRLSLIGIRHNRPDLISASIEDVPELERVSREYIRQAVGILKYEKNAEDAVDYAYRYLRSHFDEIEAHLALIQAFLSPPPVSFPPTLDKVVIGAAVCYEELPSGTPKWLVIEETDDPVIEFEEISSTSPLAIELMGKGVNEEFTLAKGSVSDREAIVKSILPKYVRRFQDCISEMQVRFGPASKVESLHIESPDAPLHIGLAKFMFSLEQRASDFSEATVAYANKPQSIHLFAGQFGKNAFEGIGSLALEDNISVKCCTGKGDEVEQAVAALQTAARIVVDLTAVGTLRLLGLEDVLKTKQYRFGMSEGTWEALNETLHDATDRSGVAMYRDGRYALYEESDEQRTERRERNKRLLDLVRENCDILPATSLASLDPEQRRVLENFFGTYGAEALAISRTPGLVLWTDDLTAAQIGAELFGARRVWTQLLLQALAEIGVVSQADYAKATANLVGFDYAVTTFDCSAILQAIKMSDSSPESAPLKQFLKVFANPGGNTLPLARLLCELIVKLQDEQVFPMRRCVLIQSFLEALWSNPAARKLVLAIRRSSRQLFGLNVVGEQDFNRCFDEWFAGHRAELL